MIKATLATIAIFASSLAHAGGVILTMQNDSGGQVELTDISVGDVVPECKGAFAAKAWGSGSDIYGCWWPVSNGNTVTIMWLNRTDGRTQTYWLRNFKKTEYGVKTYGGK
jgi:hypothetical protein